MTISTLSVLLGFADLGIGNGLVNAVAIASGRDDRRLARQAISSASIMLSALGMGIFFLALVVIRSVDWAEALRIRGTGDDSAFESALVLFAASLAAGLPLGVVQRAQQGLQLGYLSAAWEGAGALLSLTAVAVALRLHGGLVALTAAYFLAPLLCSLANSVVFFAYMAPDLRPSFSLVSSSLAGWLLKLGTLFLVLQLAVAAAFGADNLILARSLGATAVADYSVAARIFLTVSAAVALLLHPLWPAYAEAIERGDIEWVRATLRRSVLLAAALALCLSMAALVAFDRITEAWLGSVPSVPRWLLWGLAIWAVLETVGVSLAMYLNAARVLRAQVLIATLFAASCLTMKLALVPEYGPTALPWATIVTYGLISLAPAILLARRALSGMHAFGLTIEPMVRP